MPPTLRHRAACLLLLVAAPHALANDRPFQEARSAVLEDEENVWSVDTWAQRLGRVRAFSFEPEYTFTDGNSLQVELTRRVDRDGAQTGQGAEIEYKHLFNNVARDGYGWGVSAALSGSRNRDESTQKALNLKLPLTIAFGDSGGYVHLNPGYEKSSGSRGAWVAAAAIEYEVYRRTLLFAELSRDREQDFGQVGVRHWLRKEKWALDLSLQQTRGRGDNAGERASGFILGMSWYDL